METESPAHPAGLSSVRTQIEGQLTLFTDVVDILCYVASPYYVARIVGPQDYEG